MGPRINGSVATQSTSETTTVQSTETPAPPAQSDSVKNKEVPQQETKTAEKNVEGSKRHATEQKTERNLRTQYLKDQLANQIKNDSDSERGATDQIAEQMRDPVSVQAGPSDNKTIAERVKVAGDGSGTPPPTNLKEYAYDKVAEKITSSLDGVKDELKTEVHPKLSAEQEALHDVAAGMKKYKEYAAYAKNAAAILKVAPDNSKVKQALTKKLGELDDLAKNLDKAASALGKVEKYANLAKDAIGTTQAVRDLIKATPKDFSDRKAVARFADSLANTRDHAQAWFDRGKDALLAAGRSGAAVSFAYITGMASIAVDGVQAAVGNANKYIDRLERNVELIENGGVNPKEMDPPDAPPEMKTYKQLQLEEHLEKRSKVFSAVDNQFADAREAVRKEVHAKHKEVSNKFDNQVLPRIYQQNRDDLMKKLKEELKFASSDRNFGAGASAEAARIKTQLAKMEERSGSPMTPAQLQAEMRELQAHYSHNGRNLPVEQLLKNYRPELDKYYEKAGLGEETPSKLYVKHGLTDQMRDQLYAQKLKELGLDQLPF